MKLSRDLRNEFHEALGDAFRGYEELEEVVLSGSNKTLASIAGGSSQNLERVISKLVTWAEAQNRVDELAQAALEKAPKNQKLQDFESAFKEWVAESGKESVEQTPFELEPEMVNIEPGEFLMGGSQLANDAPSCWPETTVVLEKYSIGKHPVTNAEYAAYAWYNMKDVPDEMGWLGALPPEGKEDYPVVAVTWDQVLRYCKWLSEQTNHRYRLPTEAEWEKAAKGDYNCKGMLDNVSEWTCTVWVEGGNPEEVDEWYCVVRYLERSISRQNLVCKGGTSDDGQERAAGCSRKSEYQSESSFNLGFRVVRNR